VYIVGSGPTQRVTVGPARIGYTANDAGIIHLPLSSVPHVSSAQGEAAGAAAGAGAVSAIGTPGTGVSASAGASENDGRPKHPGVITIDADTAAELAAWAPRIDRMIRAGELKLRESAPDALVPGRIQQRYTQLYRGVPVFGAEVMRQVDDGETASLFGAIYENVDVNPVPKITTTEAVLRFQQFGGGGLGPSRTPELMVLPRDGGGYALTYRARIATRDDVMTYFIDANTGETVLSFSELKRPSR